MFIPNDTPNQKPKEQDAASNYRPYNAEKLLQPLPRTKFSWVNVVSILLGVVGVGALTYRLGINHERELLSQQEKFIVAADDVPITREAQVSSIALPPSRPTWLVEGAEPAAPRPKPIKPEEPEDPNFPIPAPHPSPNPLVKLEADRTTVFQTPQAVVDSLQISGVRLQGNSSRALINSRAYAIGERLATNPPLILVSVSAREIVLVDEEGSRYHRSF